MGLFSGLVRLAVAPVEIAARSIEGFCDLSDRDEDIFGVDIGTLGAARVIRKTFNATGETLNKVVEEFDK
jgi:hypothetical protein